VTKAKINHSLSNGCKNGIEVQYIKRHQKINAEYFMFIYDVLID